MPRLDEPLSPVPAGGAQRADATNGRSTCVLICDFMLSSQSKNTPRSRTTKMAIKGRIRRECLCRRTIFPEVCYRPKPHHLCFLGVQLKALRRAPVVNRRHTSSKPSSDVTNVGRLAVLDALHVVSRQLHGGGHDAARKR